MSLREVLVQIDRLVWYKRRHTKEEVEVHRLATTALSATARNYDRKFPVLPTATDAAERKGFSHE